MKAVVAAIGVIALAAFIFFAGYYSRRPISLTASSAADHRRLTPDGELCLLRYASVTTKSGVYGFPPGTRVKLIEDKGNTMLVSRDSHRLEVPIDGLTNDLDLAELSTKKDLASQQAYARAVQTAIARQNALDAEKARRQDSVAAQRPPSQNDFSPHVNPLDRGAYDKTKNVRRAPFIYWRPDGRSWNP